MRTVYQLTENTDIDAVKNYLNEKGVKIIRIGRTMSGGYLLECDVNRNDLILISNELDNFIEQPYEIDNVKLLAYTAVIIIIFMYLIIFFAKYIYR